MNRLFKSFFYFLREQRKRVP